MSLRRNIRTMLHSVLAQAPIRTAKPIRLSFRWGNKDLPSDGEYERQSIETMREMIVEYIQRFGPFPIHIFAENHASNNDISNLLRFSHRLNCPTELTLSGDDLELPHIECLIQTGVDWIWLPIGGVSAQTHEQATGVSIEQSTYVLHQLLKLRQETHTKIGILIPWSGTTPSESTAIRSWGEELGVDCILVRNPNKKFQIDSSIQPNKIFSKVLNKSEQPRWDFLSYPWSREIVVHVPVVD